MAKDPAPFQKSGTDPKAEREARLAAALRTNLRRRKAQARARQDAAPAAPEDDGTADGAPGDQQRQD
ncbi:hypothetical protein [Paracraurococcus lichenis]|uniref:DUF4169 family protein n=1 Tax=Paracraurococcus lichenis TaxID=3064888 RepID=A0ABT9E1S3_9PROT|nr:hypothetical protein [Paracraurococcus sp. LOR1-02]MDO9710052.1 hypothetical protein [Paracraurococcus sp. LOR1-02]